jgi:hypothetical protein
MGIPRKIHYSDIRGVYGILVPYGTSTGTQTANSSERKALDLPTLWLAMEDVFWEAPDTLCSGLLPLSVLE